MHVCVGLFKDVWEASARVTSSQVNGFFCHCSARHSGDPHSQGVLLRSGAHAFGPAPAPEALSVMGLFALLQAQHLRDGSARTTPAKVLLDDDTDREAWVDELLGAPLL